MGGRKGEGEEGKGKGREGVGEGKGREKGGKGRGKGREGKGKDPPLLFRQIEPCCQSLCFDENS